MAGICTPKCRSDGQTGIRPPNIRNFKALMASVVRSGFRANSGLSLTPVRSRWTAAAVWRRHCIRGRIRCRSKSGPPVQTSAALYPGLSPAALTCRRFDASWTGPMNCTPWIKCISCTLWPPVQSFFDKITAMLGLLCEVRNIQNRECSRDALPRTRAACMQVMTLKSGRLPGSCRAWYPVHLLSDTWSYVCPCPHIQAQDTESLDNQQHYGNSSRRNP